MAEASKGGPTALLYKGELFPLGTKDLEKEYTKRRQAKAAGEVSQDSGMGQEFNIPGTSGSGVAQPSDQGVVNDDKTAKKAAKLEDKK